MAAGPRAEEARAALFARLRARGAEIEEAIVTRVFALADPSPAVAPEHAEGLRSAVRIALDHGLAGIERGEWRPPPIPPLLFDQVRFAARSGIRLDTVLRCYFAGYMLLGDFLTREAEEDSSLQGPPLSRLLRDLAILFDRLLAAVGEEHTREAQRRTISVQQRRAELVRWLLDGELVDAAELAYDFEAHHIAAIAKGPRAPEAFRDVADRLDRRLLLLGREGGIVWAWLGGRRLLDFDELERCICSDWPPQVSLAFGEPAQGLAGWRLTHRQAKAALPIASRSQSRFVRYADIALLASMLKDDLLATSLRKLYLAPLARERDGGEALRETLRAYFATGRHISSTASALGTSRQTVAKRLRTVEERLSRPLDVCGADLEAALRLEGA